MADSDRMKKRRARVEMARNLSIGRSREDVAPREGGLGDGETTSAVGSDSLGMVAGKARHRRRSREKVKVVMRSIRLTERENDMLKELRQGTGMTYSELLGSWIEDLHREVFRDDD